MDKLVVCLCHHGLIARKCQQFKINKMKLNPYQIGMNFYIILIVFTLTFLGCKTFEKWDGERKIKNEVEQMFQTPDLTGKKK